MFSASMLPHNKPNGEEKDIPIIKVFRPPMIDTNYFYYTEIKKEQK